MGYQTNLVMYGPEGYRIRDFVRVGLPMRRLLGLVAVPLIALIWLL